jgi:Nif-specific regulatory protein
VAATNKNLEEAVSRGEFRADLYYRINVVSISLPPLRDRPDDMILLAHEFIRRFNEEHATEMSLTSSAKEVLEGCYFPGNVRELENCLRRTATLAKGAKIVADDFACRHDECLSSTLWKGAIPTTAPLKVLNRNVVEPPARVAVPERVAVPLSDTESVPPVTSNSCPQSDSCSVLQGDSASERERLLQAMETAGWVQAKAARLLQLTPRQIGYALRKHNIPIKRF